jgi:hypothetical protein
MRIALRTRLRRLYSPPRREHKHSMLACERSRSERTVRPRVPCVGLRDRAQAFQAPAPSVGREDIGLPSGQTRLQSTLCTTDHARRCITEAGWACGYEDLCLFRSPRVPFPLLLYESRCSASVHTAHSTTAPTVSHEAPCSYRSHTCGAARRWLFRSHPSPNHGLESRAPITFICFRMKDVFLCIRGMGQFPGSAVRIKTQGALKPRCSLTI